MIEQFIIEVNEKNDFNKLLKNIVLLSKIGCLIIYLFFILSIIIFPKSISITIWIMLIGWFTIVMISSDHFLYEKYTFSLKNKYVLKDIKYIYALLNKYELIDSIADIIKYIKEIKTNNKVNWFTIIIPITIIVLLYSNIKSIQIELIYIFIVTIVAIITNRFINSLNNGIYSKIQCNNNYI